MSTRIVSLPAIRLSLQVFLWRWGWGAAIAVCLAVAAGAMWLLRVRPLEATLAESRKELAEQRRLGQWSATQVSKSASLAAVPFDIRSTLPESELADEQVRNLILLAAKTQITFPSADYLTVRDPLVGVQRTMLTATLKANYLQVRDFVEALLRAMPNVSLDRVSFRRDNVTQSQVESQLQISIWARMPADSGNSVTRGRRSP